MRWLVLSLAFFCSISVGAEAGIPVKLEHVHININDRESLVRGAKFFAQNCMTCHTMRYMEYDKVAEAGGVVLAKMPLNQKEWLLNIVPPDLTLIARVRSADWIFTYLNSFYKDSTRPTGFNNLLKPNTVMTNILAPYQGIQELTSDGKTMLSSDYYGKHQPYYSLLKMEHSGSMNNEQFESTMTDLVNFLVYASDPTQIERKRVGYIVIPFLILFSIIAYFLKRSFWKDVKKNKE